MSKKTASMGVIVSKDTITLGVLGIEDLETVVVKGTKNIVINDAVKALTPEENSGEPNNILKNVLVKEINLFVEEQKLKLSSISFSTNMGIDTTYVKLKNFPAMKESDLEKALEEGFLSERQDMKRGDFYLSSTPVSGEYNSKLPQQHIVVGGEKGTVDMFIGVAKELKVDILTVEPLIFSTLRGVVTPANVGIRDYNVIVVESNEEYTALTIIKDGHYAHHRITLTRSPKGDEITETFEKLLIRDISDTVDYYSVEFGGQLKEILLVGDKLNDEDIVQKLKDVVGEDAEIKQAYNYFINQNSQKLFGNYISVLGLAYREVMEYV